MPSPEDRPEDGRKIAVVVGAPPAILDLCQNLGLPMRFIPATPEQITQDSSLVEETSVFLVEDPRESQSHVHLSGLDLVGNLKRAGKPVIVLSTDDSEANREETMRRGADAFVALPCPDIDQVGKTIWEFVDPQ